VLNNILLVAATGAVLFGTLYPLFLDALGLGKISVGPPYFNAVFLIPMLPLAALVGLGMHSAWRMTSVEVLTRRLRVPALIAIVLGVTVPWLIFGRTSVLTAIGVVIGLWVVGTALLEPLSRWRSVGSMRLSRGHWGMILAHLGLGVFVLGATVTSSYNLETDRTARPGDQWEVAGYEFVFRGLREVQGPNFDAVEGEFELRRGGRLVTVLTPQKRMYHVQKSPMTEAAIDAGLRRDVFVALGEPVGGGAWSVRVQYKPLIQWIWLGALIMALGGIVAVSDPRYRRGVRAAETAAADLPVGTRASEIA
jgi:cytochrome c-type biogenesis protein CcmF